MTSITQLLQDPPPLFAFELSEAGLAMAKIGPVPELRFEPFEPGELTVSPVHDNVPQPEVLIARINTLAPAYGARKRRAALILPDYSARVAVLDFDAFPSRFEEQQALVRFRMKKSVPFDVESAMVSFFPQKRATDAGKIEVLVAVVAMEIVLRYEAPLRAAGFIPGYVTTSALAMLNLLAPEGVTLVAKLNGPTLTVMVLDGPVVKLVRCVEIAEVSQEELESVILPTLAYVEDELKTAPKRVMLCGMGALGERLSKDWANEFGVAVETLRSRFGTLVPSNAGLLGYLESLT